jgi:3-dehydrosphinganine reductase
MRRQEPLSYAGRHVIVTGGSSGIGLATAHEVAARGARVTIMARTVSRLDAAAAELREAHGADGATIATRALDVADREAVEHVFAEITAPGGRGFGPCDVLVTSAGIAHPGYFEKLPDEVFRDAIEVDYFGTLWPVRAVAPAMIARRQGSIVGVASAAALVGVFGYTAYGPAKFAVRGLCEALRQELAPHGVHVGCVYPPDVDTPQLAYENRYKPAETAAISGTIEALPASAVAEAIVAGIEARRFAIIPDLQTKLLARTAGLVPELYAAVFDRSVRKARRRRGV